MSKNKKHIGEEDFKRYLKNQMTDGERNVFERELQKYPFEAEALEGFREISPDELSNDLQELRKRIKEKKPKHHYRIWAAAATLLLLLSTGILWFQLKDNRPLPELTETKTIEEEDRIQVQEQENPVSLSIPKVERMDSDSKVDKKESQVKRENELSKTLASKSSGIESVPEEIKLNKNEELKTINSKRDNIQKNEKDKIRIRGVSSLTSDDKAGDAVMPIALSNSSAKNSFVVRGKVISESDKNPVAGAVIQQKGTNNGTVADMDGNFALRMQAESNNEVVVSFVGMESQEFSPTKDSLEIIGLQPSQLALEEVVITEKPEARKKQTVGYTTVAKPLKDSSAEPIGGMDEFEKYIEKNAVLAKDYPSNKVVVKVSLQINADGEITEMENSNNADSAIFERAKQIISDGPEWIPEFKNGENIESNIELKIIFRKKK